MYELVEVSEKCYCINCPAKIGVYTPDKDKVYLVDSGNDKDAGRKVRQILKQILDKNGWHLTVILNTHSNVGYIGGNRYLQGQTGGSTVRSYLSWLKDTGKLMAAFQDSMLLWQRG